MSLAGVVQDAIKAERDKHSADAGGADVPRNSANGASKIKGKDTAESKSKADQEHQHGDSVPPRDGFRVNGSIEPSTSEHGQESPITSISISPQMPLNGTTSFEEGNYTGSPVTPTHTANFRRRSQTVPPGHNESEFSNPGSPNLSDHKQKDSVASSASSTRRHPPSAYRNATPGSPSARTGPPCSFLYSYSLPHSNYSSRANTHQEDGDMVLQDTMRSVIPEDSYFSPRPESDFRGALEYNDPEQREKEREIISKRERERRRDSGIFDEGWNNLRNWFQDAPRTEEPDVDASREKDKQEGIAQTTQENRHQEGQDSNKQEKSGSTPGASRPLLQHVLRSKSLPHIKNDSNAGARRPSAPTWRRLRSLLPNITHHTQSTVPEASTVAPHTVKVTDELMFSGLSPLLLRLWFERDEKDQRRVPILLHRLKIRITDSLHPLHGSKAVFRIECEYANGAAKWVIYRQLRDFVSLHTHYTFSNAYNRNVETMPDFPKTSLPYFKFLRTQGHDVGKAEFARMQRQGLENYLVGVIRAVMFHPTANRLAGFLEISSLSIALAQSGDAQYKAGYLRIETAGGRSGGFGRKGTRWKERREHRWCAVRESYLVVMKEPGELEVWDVFCFDPDFKIERPKRYYRQGLNFLHGGTDDDDAISFGGVKDKLQHGQDNHDDRTSLLGTIKSRMSRALHIEDYHRRHHTTGEGHENDKGHQRRRTASVPNGRPRSGSRSSGSSSSSISRPQTPMLDPSTNTNPLIDPDSHDRNVNDLRPPADSKEAEKRKKRKDNEVSKHTFYIENSQIRLKLYARNERQMLQWIAGLEKAAAQSHYTGSNRFDSFAPIRLNVAAQWLVDGRDYMWNLSRALLLAKESIYIHDWWLSPELQMRRPHMDKYRLDKLLERKAKEGVKISVILYQEVSNRTTPTDSNYAKQKLMALHPNIMVQRSPSHFQTGTFYWAHHEKLCVIDQTIAFLGGVDLCFGRWDTPQHVVVDDAEFQDGTQIWPGKDYSNARIHDFHTLDKPDEDMYDRTKIPRMPWHDVGMQVVGQPARDLARHFVQRWNWLLRIKNHSRVMPFLLPPPEFRPGELTQMGLTGTLEMQICRSAGPWSLGTPTRIERSIQNAYLKAIQLSDHFVYIENQFFISSTTVNDVKIENKIGDALVHRIIRAHLEGTPWRACIMVPLLPGFAFPVDHSDASALRIILECQNRTMFRGPDSIFARLRKEGINPDDYISIFSLRNWGKLRGDVLTTELVYIHGKICIVDDRLAIIGSANINERSQRGDRDSEIAAVIRDTDLINSTMAGKPYKVGRFAHTLRVRLMREHVGVDVDAIDEDDLMASEPVKHEYEQDVWDPESEEEHGTEKTFTHLKKPQRGSIIHDTIDEIEQAIHGTESAYSKDAAQMLRKIGLKTDQLDATVGEDQLNAERTTYTRNGQQTRGFASATVPTLEEETITERRPPESQANGKPIKEVLEAEARENKAETDDEPPEGRVDKGELYGAPAEAHNGPKRDDGPPEPDANKADASEEEQEVPGARSILRQHLTVRLNTKWTLPTPRPAVDPNEFEDPICDEFWKNVWVASAVHNTEIFRKVFHSIPDDLVTTWKQYKEFVVHHERLNKPVKETENPRPVARVPSEGGDADALADDQGGPPTETTNDVVGDSASASEGSASRVADGSENQASASTPTNQQTRKPAKGAEPFEKWEREEMEKLLSELNGHLVIYPTRFLEGEDIANNFLFNTDRLLPMPIYD
ncbi:phospholipase D [Neolentinus lepideus HHB14362 ss-1]|uniref:Phospholipase n=1 Tax=Neolentinus lepideus HHB14362 ss-1 TaxID=1314782 RepID=A0A165TYX3_9AGAM|nr:phospholipase D [Neolentinus lepideus HHB14362 ss-1]